MTASGTPLRVLLTPSSFYPNVGGVEEITRNLALRLIANNISVAVAVNQYPEDLPVYERFQGMDVWRFPFKYPQRNFIFRFPSEAIEATAQFMKFLKQWRPDIVHLICAGPNTHYTWLCKQFMPFRLVATLQGELFMDDYNLYEQSIFARLSFQQLLYSADMVTACSAHVLKDVEEHFHLKKNPTPQVIFNGVDLSETKQYQLNELPSQLIPGGFILAVGRLVQKKGFDLLIKAFASIVLHNSTLKLVIAGAGLAESELSCLIRELGLSTNIVLIRHPERQLLLSLYQNCCFFVLSSPREPFGIVCLEAMRAGKPVVAFATGGPPEFIEHNKSGYLVPEVSVSALAEALTSMLAAPDKCHAMGLIAAQRAQAFDWDSITTKYMQVYKQLCNSRQ